MNERDIFAEALERPAGDARSAYLDQACGGDTALRARLESVLAHHEGNDSFLEEPPTEVIRFAPPDPAPSPDVAGPAEIQAGVVFAGRYTLEEKLGEGGMGEVWSAFQTEPVRRRVAVKLIRPGFNSADVLNRFEQERQALALLDHPNIARVFDAGTTPVGRPFFVMELVPGVPITRYCDEARLTPQERLALFVPVCRAVQQAHQKGIVHRDLKPDNILVAVVDGRPVPKVIDFGVAKATGERLTTATLATLPGVIVGTLEYMAPEQAGGDDTDTRADVYALGAVLYELLTGLRPFAADRLHRAALLEMVRIIREEEPAKPSTRLSAADALPSLAALRRTEPRRLTSMLRGDLDWVVMKCLEKQPDRRYPTADGLARDLERFLADEPVEARPPSAAYRLRKFTRRHRGRVIALGLVLAALLAGVVGTAWGLVEARRSAAAERYARTEADDSRTVAERETARAEAGEKQAQEEKRIAQAVRGFLQKKLLGQADVAAQANALLAAGGLAADARPDVTIRELLDRAAAELSETRIEASFPNQPLVQAELLQTVGISYVGIAGYETGIALLERAVALKSKHLGPDAPGTLIAWNDLGRAYKEGGRFDRAVAVHQETLGRLTTVFGPDAPDTLIGMNNLAAALVAAGQFGPARLLLEDAIPRAKTALGLDHPLTLSFQFNLAQALRAAGRLDLALPLYEDTLVRRRAVLGSDHSATIMSLSDLAVAYDETGKKAQALPLYEETLRLTKARLGPDHTNTLISTDHLALAYLDNGKPELALPLSEQVSRQFTTRLGADHPHTLTSRNNLALAYERSGKREQAIRTFEETLRLSQVKLGADHPDTLRVLANLAVSLGKSGRWEEAVPLLEQALAGRTTKLGRSHPATLATLSNLTIAYTNTRKLDRAVPLLREVLAAQKQRLGPEDTATLSTLSTLGISLIGLGEFAEAERVLRECLAVRERTMPTDWRTFNTRSYLGAALSGLKKYAEAEPLLVKSYEGLKDCEKLIPPTAATRIPDALDRLIDLHTVTNRPDEVKKWQAERAKYPR